MVLEGRTGALQAVSLEVFTSITRFLPSSMEPDLFEAILPAPSNNSSPSDRRGAPSLPNLELRASAHFPGDQVSVQTLCAQKEVSLSHKEPPHCELSPRNGARPATRRKLAIYSALVSLNSLFVCLSLGWSDAQLCLKAMTWWQQRDT